jgi:signal transduction histidine kinase
MDAAALMRRYEELQQYVGWTAEDAGRVQAIGPLLAPALPALIDDFYDEIARHPDASKVITGGAQQIARLKGTLLGWLGDLLAGPYDRDYVTRRWRVGWRHVEIGLDQVYTNVALSRLRSGLLRVLEERWPGDLRDSLPARRSLNTLLDLDLAIIEDAYQSAYLARQQRSERLATIGQVAAGIAHELRNPLNVVKTSVYYLLNARNPPPAKTTEHLQRIERHVVLSDGVITALSSFAKQPLPNLRPFSVEQCVREALEVNPLPDNVTVTTDYPPGLPAVLADPDQVRIVLGNLIRNAREAMPEGGRLTITARLSAAESDGPACRPSDAWIDVEVTDTGVGIPADRLSRITEPLYSTKAKGLGLGLAIARALIEKNRGRLGVASEPGRGSTFTVRLLTVPPAESEVIKP